MYIVGNVWALMYRIWLVEIDFFGLDLISINLAFPGSLNPGPLKLKLEKRLTTHSAGQPLHYSGYTCT